MRSKGPGLTHVWPDSSSALPNPLCPNPQHRRQQEDPPLSALGPHMITPCPLLSALFPEVSQETK